MARHAAEKAAITQREVAADAAWQRKGHASEPCAAVQRPWALAALSLPEHAAVLHVPCMYLPLLNRMSSRLSAGNLSPLVHACASPHGAHKRCRTTCERGIETLSCRGWSWSRMHHMLPVACRTMPGAARTRRMRRSTGSWWRSAR